jgi:hypothetical protein
MIDHLYAYSSSIPRYRQLLSPSCHNMKKKKVPDHFLFLDKIQLRNRRNQRIVNEGAQKINENPPHQMNIIERDDRSDETRKLEEEKKEKEEKEKKRMLMQERGTARENWNERAIT